MAYDSDMDALMDRQAGKAAGRPAGGRMERPAGSPADGRAGWWIDGRTDIERDRHRKRQT